MSSSRFPLRLLTLLVGAISGCGGCDQTPPDPCATCRERCFMDEECDDAGCTRVPRQCASYCAEDGGCDEGRECVVQLETDAGLCTPFCVSSQCDDRRECRDGTCRDVDCGELTACLDSNAICDPWAHRCYPSEGTCQTVDDCPLFEDALGDDADVECVSGYCRVSPKPLAPVPGLGSPNVAVFSPGPGDAYLEQGAIAIEWDGPPGPGFVLILRRIPVLKSDVLDAAVWGAVAEQNTRTLTIDDGVAIVDQEWTQVPATLPLRTPLYVLVQIVEEGRLIGSSVPQPFVVGASWPGPNSKCGDASVVQGECYHPTRVQACHPETSKCSAVCLSYRDCLVLPGITGCGLPRGSLRYCE